MLTSLAIVTSLYLTNWKKATWMWDMMILENKSLSKCLLNKIHHRIAASQNARCYMYSRNAIHLIRLQNVSVQPWTQPHLTASVAPSDCGALCRSVRIKPRLASTRRPTPSEDPLSKASTISIGSEKKETRLVFVGKNGKNKQISKSLINSWRSVLLFAESICAICCFHITLHIDGHPCLSAETLVCPEANGDLVSHRRSEEAFQRVAVNRGKHPQTEISMIYLEINSTWWFNMFHSFKSIFRIFRMNNSRIFTKTPGRLEVVVPIGGRPSACRSAPAAPGSAAAGKARAAPGKAGWLTVGHEIRKDYKKMHENEWWMKLFNFVQNCMICDKWSWLKAGLESMDCGQWLILNFLRGLCYSVMRLCWALCKTIWRNFVKECGNILMNQWSPSLISEPSDLIFVFVFSIVVWTLILK